MNPAIIAIAMFISAGEVRLWNEIMPRRHFDYCDDLWSHRHDGSDCYEHGVGRPGGYPHHDEDDDDD